MQLCLLFGQPYISVLTNIKSHMSRANVESAAFNGTQSIRLSSPNGIYVATKHKLTLCVFLLLFNDFNCFRYEAINFICAAIIF